MLRTEGTLDRVQGNARLAEAPLAEEVAAALDATDKDVQIGGAGRRHLLFRRLHRQSAGGLTSRPAFPLTTLTFAIA